MTRRHFWLILAVLLTAVFLRLAALGDVPPGLTHDEADHGLDAWGVVKGVRPIYFTVGFGREPLYDYLTAVLMSFLGPSYLAGRLTSVFVSLIFIAATYAWVRKAFNGRTALLTAAGLAVGFWPLMTSRQALRSITLVAVLSLAAYFFWQALERVRKTADSSDGHRQTDGSFAKFQRSPLFSFLVTGLFLGISFYTYLPSRILWAVFPLLLLFMGMVGHSRWRQSLSRYWWQAGLMLVIAAVIGLPLYLHLMNNPGAEVRLDELSIPLTAAREGDFQPLLENTLGGLMILTFEGDHQWRYNLPGEPILSPAMGMLFLTGLLLAVLILFRSKMLWERAAVFFILVWLAAGLSPALVTGPELSTTQAIGMQPVLFIFPALMLDRFLAGQKDGRLALLVPVLFGLVLAVNANDYFNKWANEPEVRIQYETSLATTIDYLNAQGTETGISAAISTTTPDRFHSPAAGQLFLNNSAVKTRWFNGQMSLLIPQDSPESSLFFSGFAPFSPYFGQYAVGLRVKEMIPMRETDLDQPLMVYTVNGESWLEANWPLFLSPIEGPAGAAVPVQFGESAAFLGYDLQTPIVEAGQEVRLVTMWQARKPLADGSMFAQILDAEGHPLAQSDGLDVPSYYWVPGDIFLQMHRLHVGDYVADGRYTLILGLYTRGDLQRLPVMVNGTAVSDHLVLSPVEVGVGLEE